MTRHRADTLLPDASLLPFVCRKLAKPEVAWANPDLGGDRDLLEHAFCIPLEGEPADAYREESKTLLGERYGGGGIGPNGGGARCGINAEDGLQTKGTGPNPLVGATTDYWHAHGAASLLEGYREVAWGEICHIALPYGGVRVHGLIATGTRCRYNGRGADTTARRGLIVRDSALRPAHYMRAVDFEPTPLQRQLLRWNDVERTKAAIALLPQAFEALFGVPVADPRACVNDGLMELARRFARQLCVAHAKRIMHGALGGGNICLDGAWIDYGTMSTISDYGRIIITRYGEDLWRQHLALEGTLRSLHFYVQKYLPEGRGTKLCAVDDLVATFDRERRERMGEEYLKLIGVPWSACWESVAVFRDSVRECFESITRAGNREPFVLSPTAVREMPDQMGAIPLNAVVRASALCWTRADMDAAVHPSIADDRLRERFCNLVWAVREQYLRSVPDRMASNARVGLALNTIRLNAPLPELYTDRFEARVAELDPEGFAPFMEHLVRRVRTLRADSIVRSVPIDTLCVGAECGTTVDLGELTLDLARGVARSVDPTVLNVDDRRLLDTYVEKSFARL